MVIGGYGQVTDAFAARLTDLRLGCPVSKICYASDGSQSVVHTRSGLELAADAVIVSVPIGVLQSGIIQFEPPLPAWKAEALRHIGMGKLNKVRSWCLASFRADTSFRHPGNDYFLYYTR